MQEFIVTHQTVMQWINHTHDCNDYEYEYDSDYSHDNTRGENHSGFCWLLGKSIKTLCTNTCVSAKHLLQRLTASPYRSLKDMKIVAVSILFPIVIWPLLVLSLVKTMMDCIMFPLQRRYDLLPREQQLPPENLRPFQITVQSSRHHRLTGYVVPPSTEHKGTIVYFHGNGMTAHQAAYAYGNVWRQAGYCTVFATYPGYGGSEGAILSEDDLIEAGQAFIDHAKTLPQGTSTPGLILWAWSIGTGIAMRLAADNADDVSRTILHAPYYSLDSLVQNKTAGFCGCCTRYLQYHVETHQDLQRFVQNPEKEVILIHAARDRVVPFAQSEQLFQPYLEPSDEQTVTEQRNVRLLKLIPQTNGSYHCTTCNHPIDLTRFWHQHLPDNWEIDLLTGSDNPTSTLDESDES